MFIISNKRFYFSAVLPPFAALALSLKHLFWEVVSCMNYNLTLSRRFKYTMRIT